MTAVRREGVWELELSKEKKTPLRHKQQYGDYQRERGYRGGRRG